MSERPDLSPKDLKKIIGEGINDYQTAVDETGPSTEAPTQSYSMDSEPANNNPVLAEAFVRAQSIGDSRPVVIEKKRREREARIAARNAELERTGQAPKKRRLLKEIYGVDSLEDIDSVTVDISHTGTDKKDPNRE